jgi:hypothetical protein
MKTLIASIILFASFQSMALTLECEGRGFFKAPRSAIFESYEDTHNLGKSEEFILRVYKLKSCFFPHRDYRACSSVELNKVVTLVQDISNPQEYNSSPIDQASGLTATIDFETKKCHIEYRSFDGDNLKLKLNLI